MCLTIDTVIPSGPGALSCLTATSISSFVIGPPSSDTSCCPSSCSSAGMAGKSFLAGRSGCPPLTLCVGHFRQRPRGFVCSFVCHDKSCIFSHGFALPFVVHEHYLHSYPPSPIAAPSCSCFSRVCTLLRPRRRGWCLYVNLS